MDKVQTSSTLGNAYRKKYSSLGPSPFSICCMSHPTPAIWVKKSKGKGSSGPGERHLNRIAQIPVPTRKPGWYLLTVTLDNGYRFHRFSLCQTWYWCAVPCRKATSGSWRMPERECPWKGAALRLLRYQEDKTLQKHQVKGTTDKDGAMIETILPAVPALLLTTCSWASLPKGTAMCWREYRITAGNPAIISWIRQTRPPTPIPASS